MRGALRIGEVLHHDLIDIGSGIGIGMLALAVVPGINTVTVTVTVTPWLRVERVGRNR